MVVNGFSAFLSFTVVLIFAVAKFKEGAWLIVVVGPLLYIGLIRLHRQYVAEAEHARDRRRRGVRGAPSCAATWSSSSSTASTWPPPGPSSTPAR